MQAEEIFIEEKLAMYLFLLKVYPNIKGYIFLKEAVKRIVADPTMKFNVRRRLYLLLAKELNEKEELIDRGLRHAIDVSYRKNGIRELEKFTCVRFNTEKPSPREIMCMLAEILMMDIEQFRRNPRRYTKTLEEIEL